MMKAFCAGLALMMVLAMSIRAADAPPAPSPRQRVIELRKLLDAQPIDQKAINAAFYEAKDAEVVIVAGKAAIDASEAADLVKVLTRLIEFPSPLPAMNLGPYMVQKFDAKEIRTHLTSTAPSANWWGQRNLAILLGCFPDPSVVAPLAKLAAAKQRPVKLESIMSLSYVKQPQAVAALQGIFTATKEDDERAACLRAMATCGTETDIAWILRQLTFDGHESITGAWAVAQLTKKLPVNETRVLLNHASIYARRAGLQLMWRLATPEQWMEQLKLRTLQQADVLEAVAIYFSHHPDGEAARHFIAAHPNCAHKDYRVADAWCRALGACAALADAALQDQAFKILAGLTVDAFKPLTKGTVKLGKARESGISPIYGLEQLGTSAAREHLTRIALGSTDDVIAMYALAGLINTKDPNGIVALNKIREDIAATREKSKDMFLRAVSLLGQFPHKEAVETLFDCLARAPDEPCRLAVRDALAKATGHDFGNDSGVWKNWWKTADFEFFEDKMFNIRRVADAPLEKVKTPISPFDERPALDCSVLRRDKDWALNRFGGDAETEDAVNAGLRWLAEHQDPDGKWSAKLFVDHNTAPVKDANVAMSAGRQDMDIGVTGLALMTYMAANHTHLSDDSIYRDTVARGMNYFLSRQVNDGAFEEATETARGGFNFFNYGLGIAALVFSESFALTKDPSHKLVAQAALEKIFSVQNPGEGWRYVPRNQTDTSVVGWMVMALKSGMLAGLEVDPRARLSALRYYDLVCTRPKSVELIKDNKDEYDGKIGETNSEEAHATYMNGEKGVISTAAAISAGNRIFFGYSRSHPYAICVGNYLKAHLPQWDSGKKAPPPPPGEKKPPANQQRFEDRWLAIYYMYYGTVFMHQMGGEHWNIWNKGMKKALLGAQLKAPHPYAGAFPATGWDGDAGGQVYSTAMCVLTLETYYRYLPMLWFKEAKPLLVKADPNKPEIKVEPPAAKPPEPVAQLPVEQKPEEKPPEPKPVDEKPVAPKPPEDE